MGRRFRWQADPTQFSMGPPRPKDHAKRETQNPKLKTNYNLVLMWIRIRAVIIEDEPLAAQYLAALLDDTCQVEVVGLATESEAGLRLCAELRPDAVFVDINLPGKDGVSLATQLAMLPQPPRLVFTTGNPNRATDAFRLEAVDYLLKPLDPEQVTEAVNRLLAYLRPFEAGSFRGSRDHSDAVPAPDKVRFSGMAKELLPVKDVYRDQIRLLARREVAAVLRREQRTWVHTVREEFATYYPVADLVRWLGGDPFIQISRHAVVNLQAIEHVTHYGDRLYRVRLRDRASTEINASRTGAARLAAVLKATTRVA
jgi:DNA-binding LytR/AlgR family response regulator